MKKYAGVLVRANNKVLLCKRAAYQTRAGEWSVPAGSVEKGEDVMSAAKREYFEETNLDVPSSLKMIGAIKRLNREGDKVKGLLTIYLADSTEEPQPDLNMAKDGDEHTECGCFSKDNLPYPVSPQLTKIINLVLK